MPEDTSIEPKTHAYNANWNQSSNPSPPPINDLEGENHDSSFPKRLIKISGLIFLLITLFFAFIVFVLPIFSNSSSQESGGGDLTYWGTWQDQRVMDGVISDFEKENPNIKVKFVKQDLSQYRERVTTRIQNGSGPDIFSFHNSWYPMVSNVLSPLMQDVITKDQFVSDYYDVIQKDLIKNGKVVGIPLQFDTLALFVNTKILSDAGVSPPNTWQAFIDASSKLTKRDDSGKIQIAGAAIGTYDNINYAPDIISLLFAQNGVDLGNIQKSQNKVEDALQFYTNFSLIENNVWDATLDKSLLAFSQGKAAMAFGYAKDYANIRKQNPSLPIKAVLAPQLYQPSKKNIASYWVEGVSNQSKNPKAAMIFMRFLARPETEQKIFDEEAKINGLGLPYSQKSLADKLKGSEIEVFQAQADSAISTPFADGTNDNGLNDGLNKSLRDSVNKYLSNSFDQTTVIDTLFQGYSQVIGQYTSGR